MEIQFIPINKQVEEIVPKPKPAKRYIPEWYRDLPEGALKKCVPFLDSMMHGYIQETWADFHIKKNGDDVEIIAPEGPIILSKRQSPSLRVPDHFYNIEFFWEAPWVVKLPEGWSMMFITPINNINLPFVSLSGLIDSDQYYHTPYNRGGRYPFYMYKDFEGVIPKGTPMYQMIPIKREDWTASYLDYSEEHARNIQSFLRDESYSGYKKEFWSKKSFE